MSAVPSPAPQSPPQSVGECPATGKAPPPFRVAPRPDPLYHSVILILCTGVIVLSVLLSVRGESQVLVPVLGVPLPELCMTKRWFGFGCPGCGMTRSFISLGHGDWLAALHFNPAGPLLFAVMAFQIPLRLVQLARIRRGLAEIRLGWATQAVFGVLGVVMVGQWILRPFGVGF